MEVLCMKTFARWALGIALCLSLLVVGALAADDSNIKVQLDGENLTFTDAVPQVVDQRTFLPFRAVFEAMGAQVDNEGNVITAVRGDKVLTMTIGSTQATVTENGATATITMDVAPYVDPATWRTYVPVRFAAQAFDCVVGWDQDAYTAIVIDAEKLVDEAAAGKSFTYLQKVAEMSKPYETGIWNVEGGFDMNMSAFILPLLTADGSLQGTIQDGSKVSMDMAVKMDMSGLLTMSGSELTAEDQAALAALANNGMTASVRGDMTAGKLYENIDMSALGELASQTGYDPNTWYEVDLAAMMEQAGMDWVQLMSASHDVDYQDLLVALLGIAEPDNAQTDYADIKAFVDSCVGILSDDGFVRSGNTCTAAYALEDILNLSLTLEMEGENLKSYTVAAELSVDSDEAPVNISLTSSMDATGQMQAKLSGNISMFLFQMTIDGAYTPGTVAPVTAPPAGANIVSFQDLIAASMP